MPKWISTDLQRFPDANGNGLWTIAGITGMKTQSGDPPSPPILGVANRIGLGLTEPTLPRCTFWVPGLNAGYGYLMVRGDPGTEAWFRVGAFQP